MQQQVFWRQGCRPCLGHRLALGVVLAMCFAAVGCGQKGSDRFDYTGQVTYRGQPVPRGYMIFAPDRAKGNGGPGSKAGIIDGRYEMLKGQGVIGGPHVVSIVGTDGVPYDQGAGVINPAGREIFPEYTAHVDFPKESGTMDFVVPDEPVK